MGKNRVITSKDIILENKVIQRGSKWGTCLGISRHKNHTLRLKSPIEGANPCLPPPAITPLPRTYIPEILDINFHWYFADISTLMFLLRQLIFWLFRFVFTERQALERDEYYTVQASYQEFTVCDDYLFVFVFVLFILWHGAYWVCKIKCLWWHDICSCDNCSSLNF